MEDADSDDDAEGAVDTNNGSTGVVSPPSPPQPMVSGTDAMVDDAVTVPAPINEKAASEKQAARAAAQGE